MDIIGNIYKQNCGDYLKVLNKVTIYILTVNYNN